MKAIVCIGGCDYLVEGTYTPCIPDLKHHVEIDSCMQLREVIPGRTAESRIDSVMLAAAIEQGNAVELIADLDMEFLSEVQIAFAVEGRKQMFQNICDAVERFCANVRNQPIIIDYLY